MATIDEILAAMPEEAAADYEYLTIDPDGRTIFVPEGEELFGVPGDDGVERKHFRCPRYVANGLDLAGMFLTVYYRNANGDEDGYLVNDKAVSDDFITFIWELDKKVTAYMGTVEFSVCADLPNTATKRRPDWNTTTATGTVLEGLHPDLGDVEGQTSNVVTQLREMVTTQTAAVEAVGAEQVADVERVGAEQVAAVEAAGGRETAAAVETIQAQGAATLASLPADYTDLANTVDGLTRSRAAAIVCEAEGTAVQVADASADPLLGLRIFGRSTQDGTPTPDAPVDIVSLAAPVVTVSDGTGDNVQTLTVTTPDGLPGIPVSSGGNYTDANGQQWIADEVDLARGVYVQRICERTLTGNEHCILNAKATEEGVKVYQYYTESIKPIANAFYCSHFANAGQWMNGLEDLNNIAWHTRSVLMFKTDGVQTLEDFTAFVAAKYAANAPIKIWFAMETPIETPLSDAELQAWRALHSYKPNTTVLTDAGAFMALEYAADPKTYIDNKLAALTAAT